MHDAIRDESGRRKRYGERDPIGVEGPSETHRRGINAELEFIREQATAQLAEHDSRGVHDTPQIARVFLEYRDGELTGNCYARGTRGDGIAIVTSIATGRYQIELADAMPSDRYRIMDASVARGFVDLYLLGLTSSPLPWPLGVRLERIIDERRFEIGRWIEATDGTLDLENGDFAIFVFAEA